jgi:hypothetical protein
MKGQIKVGTYTGTGSAINVELGFAPDFVMVWNITDGDVIGLWTSDMTDDTAIDIAAAVAGNAAGGISAYAGASASTGAGFTAGADYSESAKVMGYIALSSQ